MKAAVLLDEPWVQQTITRYRAASPEERRALWQGLSPEEQNALLRGVLRWALDRARENNPEKWAALMGMVTPEVIARLHEECRRREDARAQKLTPPAKI